MKKTAILTSFIIAVAVSPLAAEMPKKDGIPETVSYYEHVRPVFQAKCQGCHQPAKAKADYVMTEVAQLLAGGENGEAVIAGKPAESYLVELITKKPDEDRPEMPPKDEPLSDYERKLVTKWIAQGAKDDTPENAKARYSQKNLPKYAVAPVITSLDYSPDGKLLAVAGFHEVLVHKADGSSLVARLVGLSERIETVAFSPDGKRLAVAGGLPGRMGEIQVWDLAKNELKISKIVGYDTAYGASWSPDGTMIAFGLPDNTARAIDAKTGKQKLFMGSHSDWVLATDWGQKGDFLVSVGRDMTAKLTEVKTERFVDNLTSITPGALKGGMNAVKTHPKQNHILIGGSDGVPQIYRMKRETIRKIGDNANLIRKYPAMKGRIWDVAFRPDGKQFVAVSSLNGKGEIGLYQSEYDATITPKLKKLFETVRRAPDGADAENDEIEEWTTRGAERLAQLKMGAALFSVVFSPDGKWIAAGGADGQVRILNAADLTQKVAFTPIKIEGELEKRTGKKNPIGLAKGKRHELDVAPIPVDVEGTMEKPVDLPKGRTVTALEITPAKIVMNAPGTYSQVLVMATLNTGEKADLTRMVAVSTDAKIVTVTNRGIAKPVGEGTAKLTATFGKIAATADVIVTGLKADFHPDFIRDVNPVISRLGCNMGTCHGAKDGKGGFKLSLRGYDKLYDVRAFSDDHTARRVNYASPDDSLMLLKATGAVPHEPGILTEIGSDYYNIIRQWIADGAKLKGDTPKVVGIEIFPKNPVIQNVGGKQQFRVIARWADGTTRDVTQESYTESGNTEVAQHDDFGLMATVRRGEAPILARYEGAYASTVLTVMGDRDDFTWKEPETWSKIDELVTAKWKRMKIGPSGVCTDSEFIRRVHLDLTGLPPRSDTVRSFLADKRAMRVKRDEIIDKLIGSPAFVDHWTNKWSDMLQVNSKFLGGEGAKLFRDWIKKEIAGNTPYDEFAYKILTASGSNKDNPAASYFKILREPDIIMENTTHLFLATRFNCNKCHDHPFERWTQDQYYETAAYFAQTGLARDAKNAAKSNIGGSAVEGAKPLYEVISDKADGEMKHDLTGEVSPPKFPYETKLAKVVFTKPEAPTRREKMAAWITSADNQYFAYSYANRIWGYLLGTGIIEPLDDIRAGNPPSNPELLNYLTAQFKGTGFNVRDLMREICKSRTYQLSIRMNKWNETDDVNFSHGKARRLPAETLFDTIYFVTGATPDIPGAGKGVLASQLYDAKQDLKSGFLANLGRPVRESACECERSADMQMSAVMAFLSGPAIADAVGAPDSELAKLVKTQPDDKKLIDEIYYRVLSRAPKPKEVEAALANMAEIEGDHEVLIRDLAKAESAWVGKKSELDIARFKRINKANVEIEGYTSAFKKKKAADEAAQKGRVAAAKKAIDVRRAEVPKLTGEFVKSVKAEQLWTQWNLLPVATVTTSNESKVEVQADGSVRSMVPFKKQKLDYLVTANLKAQNITGIMIESVPDVKFGGGAGLNPNGNFVISEVKTSWNTAAAPKKSLPIPITAAKATFNQKGFDVKNAFNGKSDRSVKGWALSGADYKVPHRAVFKFKAPVKGDAKGAQLAVNVMCGYSNGDYPIGRFRIYYTTAADPLQFGLPEAVAKAVQIAPASRNDAQKKALSAYVSENDADLSAKRFAYVKQQKPLPADAKMVQLKTALTLAERPIKEDLRVTQLRQDMTYSVQQSANRRLTAAQDLVWALVNSPAFLFNH